MSKQDTHFINIFSIVIGLLVAVAIGLFVLSRVVGGRTQEQQILAQADYVKSVEERIRPFARVAVAGQDNSALAIEESPAPGGAAGGEPGSAAAGGEAPASASGVDVFNQACTACHGQGIAGAPKVGDKAAWGPRIAKGNEVLYMHAIQGYQGESGIMPPKGGFMNLSDDQVKAAVDYMVGQSR